MRTQIRRVGNSAGIVIPSVVLKEVNLELGNAIDLSVVDGKLEIRPLNVKKRGSRELDLNWLLEDFKDLNEDLITGPRVGAEVIEDEYEEDWSERTSATATR